MAELCSSADLRNVLVLSRCLETALSTWKCFSLNVETVSVLCICSCVKSYLWKALHAPVWLQTQSLKVHMQPPGTISIQVRKYDIYQRDICREVQFWQMYGSLSFKILHQFLNYYTENTEVLESKMFLVQITTVLQRQPCTLTMI